MKVTVWLPSFLRRIIGNDELLLEFEKGEVKLIDVLLELENRVPDAKGRIVNGETPNRFITYFINDEDSRFFQFGGTLLKDGDKVALISAIAGG